MTMTNPRQEAEDRLGGRYEVRVLEPSPPAQDGNLDDPTARGEPSSRRRGDHPRRFPPERGEALTAIGLMSRFFLGQNPQETPVMMRAAETILRKPPVWDTKSGSIDHYYWYYATYALYQMGGNYWTEWSKKLTPAVVKTQREDGNFKGSWDAIGAWGEDGGRVYSTATLVLTLEAYYRYTRLVR